MIRTLAFLAMYCFLLIPVMAFTGDLDARETFAALWPRMLVLFGVLGFLFLAIRLAAGRHRPEEFDEHFETQVRPSISPALAGFYGGLLISLLIVLYVLFHDQQWVRDISLRQVIMGVVFLALILALRFDGWRNSSDSEPSPKTDTHG